MTTAASEVGDKMNTAVTTAASEVDNTVQEINKQNTGDSAFGNVKGGKRKSKKKTKFLKTNLRRRINNITRRTDRSIKQFLKRG